MFQGYDLFNCSKLCICKSYAFKFNCYRDDEGFPIKLVKVLKTEPQNEPQCIMKSTNTKGTTTLMIISGSNVNMLERLISFLCNHANL